MVRKLQVVVQRRQLERLRIAQQHLELSIETCTLPQQGSRCEDKVFVYPKGNSRVLRNAAIQTDQQD